MFHINRYIATWFNIQQYLLLQNVVPTLWKLRKINLDKNEKYIFILKSIYYSGKGIKQKKKTLYRGNLIILLSTLNISSALNTCT